jgi:hypothetical protein
MLFMKIIAVFCKNFTEYMNSVNAQHATVKYCGK